MISYSNDHNPPAPALQVTVANVVNRRLRRVLPALLDTEGVLQPFPTFVFRP